MLTVEQVATKWRVSEQRVRQWLAAGRIPRAVKFSRVWTIPDKAKRPAKLGNGAKA